VACRIFQDITPHSDVRSLNSWPKALLGSALLALTSIQRCAPVGLKTHSKVGRPRRPRPHPFWPARAAPAAVRLLRRSRSRALFLPRRPAAEPTAPARTGAQRRRPQPAAAPTPTPSATASSRRSSAVETAPRSRLPLPASSISRQLGPTAATAHGPRVRRRSRRPKPSPRRAGAEKLDFRAISEACCVNPMRLEPRSLARRSGVS